MDGWEFCIVLTHDEILLISPQGFQHTWPNPRIIGVFDFSKIIYYEILLGFWSADATSHHAA